MQNPLYFWQLCKNSLQTKTLWTLLWFWSGFNDPAHWPPNQTTVNILNRKRKHELFKNVARFPFCSNDRCQESDEKWSSKWDKAFLVWRAAKKKGSKAICGLEVQWYKLVWIRHKSVSVPWQMDQKKHKTEFNQAFYDALDLDLAFLLKRHDN